MSQVTNWHACATSLAFVAHQSLTRSALQTCTQKHHTAIVMTSSRQPRDDDDDDDDLVFSTVDKLSNALSTPTPGFPSLPIVYPLILISAAFVVPLPTALLLTVFFIGFSFLANQVLGENDGKVDFAVLLASIASAGLLSPSGFSNINGQGLAAFVAIVAIALISLSIFETLPSQEEKELDKWDDRFDKEKR